MLGLVALLTVGTATVGFLSVRGVVAWPATEFILFKSLWAAGLAALVGPVIAWSALAEGRLTSPAAQR